MNPLGGGIVLASSNPGKLAEIAALLADTGLSVAPQQDFGVRDAAETGATFVENALIKARNAARVAGRPALADDSGLCVDALAGRPGIHSARYAGPAASDAENVARLLAELAQVEAARRSARFQCVLVFLRHAADPMPLICQGTWAGSIQTTSTGSRGFGYDPVFHVPEHGASAAELAPATKNRISHRGQALAAMQQALARHYPAGAAIHPQP